MLKNLSCVLSAMPLMQPVSIQVTQFGAVDKKMLTEHVEETQWLKELVPRLHAGLRQGLVAHRGFHCPLLHGNRPLECTLPALKLAWESGIRLCECDVRLSSDGEVLVFHDETLDRLSAQTETPKIRELTAEQLRHWKLLQPQSHISSLEEMLETASATSGKLIIELKGSDGPSVGRAVATSFGRKPELLKACALVMSFELDELRGFSSAFAEQKCLSTNEKLERPQLLLLTCAPHPGLATKYQTLDLGSSSCMETASQYLGREDRIPLE